MRTYMKRKPNDSLTEEQWKYLKQDLVKVKGTNRIISEAASATPYNIGSNKSKRSLREAEKTLRKLEVEKNRERLQH